MFRHSVLSTLGRSAHARSRGVGDPNGGSHFSVKSNGNVKQIERGRVPSGQTCCVSAHLIPEPALAVIFAGSHPSLASQCNTRFGSCRLENHDANASPRIVTCSRDPFRNTYPSAFGPCLVIALRAARLPFLDSENLGRREIFVRSKETF
jgi:hypothetical protein